MGDDADADADADNRDGFSSACSEEDSCPEI